MVGNSAKGSSLYPEETIISYDFNKQYKNEGLEIKNKKRKDVERSEITSKASVVPWFLLSKSSLQQCFKWAFKKLHTYTLFISVYNRSY